MRILPDKYLILVLVIAALFTNGCSNISPKPGILQGDVSIGPITPVQISNEPVIVPCEVYKARKILVYNEKANRLIQQVDINCDGRYVIELKPGTYMVDINRIGIDSSPDVPHKIEISSGLTVILDIDIDTGIR